MGKPIRRPNQQSTNWIPPQQGKLFPRGPPSLHGLQKTGPAGRGTQQQNYTTRKPLREPNLRREGSQTQIRTEGSQTQIRREGSQTQIRREGSQAKLRREGKSDSNKKRRKSDT